VLSDLPDVGDVSPPQSSAREHRYSQARKESPSATRHQPGKTAPKLGRYPQAHTYRHATGTSSPVDHEGWHLGTLVPRR
jgi:hypothetical protein